MNLFDVFLLCLVIIFALIGWKRGLLKSVWDILNLIVSAVLTRLISPKLAVLCIDKTPFGAWMQKQLPAPGTSLHKLFRLPDAGMDSVLGHQTITVHMESHPVLKAFFDFAGMDKADIPFRQAFVTVLLSVLIALFVFLILFPVLGKLGTVLAEKLQKRFESANHKKHVNLCLKIGGSLIYILCLVVAGIVFLNQPAVTGSIPTGNLQKSLSYSLLVRDQEPSKAVAAKPSSSLPGTVSSSGSGSSQTQPSSPPQPSSQTQPNNPSGSTGTQTASPPPAQTLPQVSPPPVQIDGVGEYQPLGIPLNEIIPSMNTTPLVIDEKPDNAQFVINSYIGPADENRKFVSDTISVLLPAAALQQYAQLSAMPQDRLPVAIPDGMAMPFVYNVSLSNMSVLPEAVEIEIPYSGTGNVGAIYYNERERQWEQVPWRKTGGSVLIKTNHLSSFGVTEVKDTYNSLPNAKVWFWYPSSTVSYTLSDIEKIMADSTGKSAMTYGWEAAKTWFDIGALSGSLINDVIYEVPGLSTVNKVVGNMGLGFSSLQILSDVAYGKAKSAGSQAYEAAMGFAVAKWGLKGLQIGFIGVTLINQALLTFTKEAIAGKEKVYEDAYNLYYSRNSGISTSVAIRKTADWFNTFKSIIKTAASSEEATRKIQEDIESYVNAFWNDVDGRSQCFAYITQRNTGTQSFGFDAGINDGLKKRLNDNHKAHLNDFLNNILTRVMIQLENEEIERFQNEEMQAVAEALNQEYALSVRVEGRKTNLEGLNIHFNGTANQSYWQGKTSMNGDWGLRYTLLGYLRAGMPDKVILTDGNGKTYTVDFNPETTLLTFHLDQPDPLPELGINPEKTIVTPGEPIRLNPVLNGKPVSKGDVVWETDGGFIQDNTFLSYNSPGTYTVRARTANHSAFSPTVQITVTEDRLSQKIKECLDKYGYILSSDIDYSKAIRSVSADGEVFFNVIEGLPNESSSGPSLSAVTYPYLGEGMAIRFARKSTFENAALWTYPSIWAGPDASVPVPYDGIEYTNAEGILRTTYPPLDLLSLSESEWNDIVPVCIRQTRKKENTDGSFDHGMQLSFFHIEPVSPEFLSDFVEGRYLAHGQPVVKSKDTAWRLLDEPRIAYIFHCKDGNRHGECVSYYLNGKLREKATYENNEPRGSLQQYYLNGSPFQNY